METLYVALIRPDDSIEIHEELPAADAPHRRYMLSLQAELYDRDGKPGYRIYCGAPWPPPGYKLYRGRLKPVEAPAAEAGA